jgi:hypothetical protein
MADTIVRYSATLSQTDFTIPFDYINENDVYVALNGTLLTKPAQWDFVNDGTARLATPCAQGDAVVIQRRTEDSNRLVDFQTGAVLTETDLDLAHKQTFYLIQEMRDALNDVANASIIDVTAEQLEAIGQEILSQAVADDIQARITDIDTAGELLIDALMQRRVLGEVNDDWSGFKLDTGTVYLKETGVTLEEQFNAFDDGITTLAQDISLLGARNGAGTAFILDVDTVLVSPSETLSQRFAALVAETEDAFAAILSEETARISGDSALASSITTLTATVGGHTGSITTLSSVQASLVADVAVIEANWGVSVNVDGHITGINLNNDGDTGVFAILADEFYIVDPANGLGSPTTVFGVAGGVVSMQNAYVAGDLLVDGTITANFEFNGGTIEIPTDGYIFSGSSTFFGATGWWIGTDTGDPRLFFGDPSGDYIRFQNGVLTIAGGVSFPGGFTSDASVGATIGRNDTNEDSNFTSAIVHPFTVRGSGTIAVVISARDGLFPGGGMISLVQQGTVEVRRNGVTVAGPTAIAASAYTDVTFTGITVTDPTDAFDIVLQSATYNDGLADFQSDIEIDYSEVRARLSHVIYS